MGKIGIDKFVVSIMNHALNDGDDGWVHVSSIIKALQDQGLYYHDGQIVTEIQKKLLDMSKPRSQEAIEKAEKRKEEREKKASKIVFSDGQEIKLDLEHLKGTDMDGGVIGEMGSNAVVDDEDEQVYMKEFIEKACTWLRNFYDAERGSYFVERDIEDFRKYMEEQQ